MNTKSAEIQVTVTVSFMAESCVFTGKNYIEAWEKGQVWKQAAMHAYDRMLEKVSFLNLKAHKEARTLPYFLHSLTEGELNTAVEVMMENSAPAKALGKEELTRRFKAQAASYAATLKN
jgi:hypothetical protein